MTRAQSRKHRGMKTQALLAERWREAKLFPFATDAGAGRQGNDVLNTPGLKVEVKARDDVSLPAAIRQARTDEKGTGIPIVVWRHNGQGEGSMDEWTVTMSLADFELLWHCATDDNSALAIEGEE